MSKSAEPRRKPIQREGAAAALRVAARAGLENRAFEDAARAVLAACRAILHAEAGFVAVCAADGRDLEIVVVDPGGFPLDTAAGLPAPVRRLSERAVESGRTLLANDLSKRKVTPSAADRGSATETALVAPILLADDVAGLLGLTNKPGGFSAADSQLVEVFAEMAAVAMRNSRTLIGLENKQQVLEAQMSVSTTHLHEAEEHFRSLVQNLPDIVARFDPMLRHLYISPAVERVTGRPAEDFIGKTNLELGVLPVADEPWEAALRRAFATGNPEQLEFTLPAEDGARHFDCRIVPERGPGGAVATVPTVARDVTDRWLAFEAERHARAVAEALREATVVLTRSLDRESVLVTLLDRLRRMVPFDRARVMLVEGASRLSVRAVFDGDRAVPLSAESRTELDATDHPIVHDILTTGAAVLIPDTRAHPGWSLPTDRASEVSWMGVPLFARGDVAGLFSLSKREVDYFKEQHVKLAEALSSQASVAVENAVLFEQMQASSARMKALSRRLVEAQESERRHIALELHDEAGQALVSLRLGLRLLEREIAEGGSVTARVAELVETTDGVIDGLHRLAADLRPASLDHLGLEAALRQYTRSIASKFDLAVRFKSHGFTSQRLPQSVETTLYRVVQEAMTNVVRHAHANRVDVLAQLRDDKVLVMVEDDGAWFDPSRVQSGEHLGLLGMRERADALGGTLIVESAPGKGTTIVVEVPSADPHPDR